MATLKNFPNNADEYIGAEYVMRWLHGRTSGVYGADGNLSVTANDNMTVSVSDGVGWLANSNADGCVFWNDNENTLGSKLSLSIALANASLPRIDRVVVSWDTVDYTAKPTIEILQGSPASQPKPPALTNTTLKRQISLAQVRVGAGASKITASDITDERLNSGVCGIVTESVSVDTTTMQAQFEAFLALIQAELDNINAGTEAMLKTTYDPKRRERNIFADVPYKYKAFFDVDSWAQSGGEFTQTATLVAMDDGPDVSAYSEFLPGVACEKSTNAETNETLQDNLTLFQLGYSVASENQITAHLFEKPTSDMEVIWTIKEGDYGD